MAKERVQVQGLGDVAPGIQPTIQRAGQYGIQVQRAGRNKLMDLADALSQVNPTLQQYIGVAEQEAEMFEEELARKSPEEVQAMLKQTEGELDKQVRRGTMGWLTSPLNQKRKMRAIGKRASRDLMVEINRRLTNPKADDPEDGADLVNLVRDEYINQNPALADSMFAREGLQEALNSQTPQLITVFENRKSFEAKTDLITDESNNITLAAIGGYADEGGFTDEAKASFIESWSALGALNSKEQKDVLKATFRGLARKEDGEVIAREFLDWADENLKIGPNKISVIDRGEFEELISNVSETAEKRRDEDNKEFTDNIEGLALKLIGQLKYATPNDEGQKFITHEGQQFSSNKAIVDFLEQQVLENPDLDNATIGDIRVSLNTIRENELRDADAARERLIKYEATDANRNAVKNVFSVITASAQVPADILSKPEVIAFLREEEDRLNLRIQSKLDTDLMGLDPSVAARELNKFARDIYQDEKFVNRITQQLKTFRDEDEALIKGTEVTRPFGSPAPKPEDVEDIDSYYLTDVGKLEDTLDKASTWISLINQDPNDVKSNKAKGLYKKYIPDVVNELAKAYRDDSYRNSLTPRFSLSKEEAFENFINSGKHLEGLFTGDLFLQLDDKGMVTTKAGISFDPKEVIGSIKNVETPDGKIVDIAEYFPMLTQDQIDNFETDEGKQTIQTILDNVGLDMDPFKFIRLQKKARKKIITDYKSIEYFYQPLNVEEELQRLINSPSVDLFDPFPEGL